MKRPVERPFELAKFLRKSRSKLLVGRRRDKTHTHLWVWFSDHRGRGKR